MKPNSTALSALLTRDISHTHRPNGQRSVCGGASMDAKVTGDIDSAKSVDGLFHLGAECANVIDDAKN